MDLIEQLGILNYSSTKISGVSTPSNKYSDDVSFFAYNVFTDNLHSELLNEIIEELDLVEKLENDKLTPMFTMGEFISVNMRSLFTVFLKEEGLRNGIISGFIHSSETMRNHFNKLLFEKYFKEDIELISHENLNRFSVDWSNLSQDVIPLIKDLIIKAYLNGDKEITIDKEILGYNYKLKQSSISETSMKSLLTALWKEVTDLKSSSSR